ncbi:MAG: response regulator [Rhodothermia bacterium]|nr:response regulator [Rhodothermia bacterium]
MLQSLIQAYRFAAEREASDQEFEAELARLVRSGLFIAGILGLFGIVANMIGWISAGLKVTLWYNVENPVLYVALPDKLLIILLCLLSIFLSRVMTRPQSGRYLMATMVVVICFFSMLDDYMRGDLSSTSGWLVLFLVVGTGAVPFRPKQVLVICALVMFLYFIVLQIYTLDEVAATKSRTFVIADITYLAIVSAVFFVINIVLHETRFQQFRARKEAVELREKSEKQAQELIRLERQKRRLFANIGHEFQTPLTLISGPIRDALLANPDMPKQVRENLELAERSSNEILRLVREVIEVEKLDSGELSFLPEVFDLVVFMEEVLYFFQPFAAQKEVFLYLERQYSSLPVYADKAMMRKVVQNLVSNAIKFSNPTGQVKLVLDQVVQPNDLEAIIEVQDQGIGIRPEDLDAIFTRHYQVERDKHFGGFGIGLSFAQELVQKHGGQLSVESTLGKGSTFRVVFPIQTDKIITFTPDTTKEELRQFEQTVEKNLASGSSCNENALHKTNKRHNTTILLVDDQPSLRAYLRRLLEVESNIVDAADGQEALDQLKTHKIDLVISDINMPKLDGFGLLKAIREHVDWQRIPVILLTNRTDKEDIETGYALLADEYLAKPFNGEMLLRRVENLIHIRRMLFASETEKGHEKSPQDRFMTIEDQEWLEKLKGLIASEMGSSLMGVEWLASEMAMSSRNLGRRVKQLTGLTPNGMVRMMQMERASHLLIHTSKSVVEIAGLVGYQDAKHFSLVFSQVFTMPPSEYRRTKRPA